MDRSQHGSFRRPVAKLAQSRTLGPAESPMPQPPPPSSQLEKENSGPTPGHRVLAEGGAGGGSVCVPQGSSINQGSSMKKAPAARSVSSRFREALPLGSARKDSTDSTGGSERPASTPLASWRNAGSISTVRATPASRGVPAQGGLKTPASQVAKAAVSRVQPPKSSAAGAGARSRFDSGAATPSGAAGAGGPAMASGRTPVSRFTDDMKTPTGTARNPARVVGRTTGKAAGPALAANSKSRSVPDASAAAAQATPGSSLLASARSTTKQSTSATASMSASTARRSASATPSATATAGTGSGAAARRQASSAVPSRATPPSVQQPAAAGLSQRPRTGGAGAGQAQGPSRTPTSSARPASAPHAAEQRQGASSRPAVPGPGATAQPLHSSSHNGSVLASAAAASTAAQPLGAPALAVKSSAQALRSSTRNTNAASPVPGPGASTKGKGPSPAEPSPCLRSSPPDGDPFAALQELIDNPPFMHDPDLFQDEGLPDELRTDLARAQEGRIHLHLMDLEDALNGCMQHHEDELFRRAEAQAEPSKARGKGAAPGDELTLQDCVASMATLVVGLAGACSSSSGGGSGGGSNGGAQGSSDTGPQESSAGVQEGATKGLLLKALQATGASFAMPDGNQYGPKELLAALVDCSKCSGQPFVQVAAEVDSMASLAAESQLYKAKAEQCIGQLSALSGELQLLRHQALLKHFQLKELSRASTMSLGNRE